jgi:hypothetical protein
MLMERLRSRTYYRVQPLSPFEAGEQRLYESFPKSEDPDARVLQRIVKFTTFDLRGVNIPAQIWSLARSLEQALDYINPVLAPGL